MKKAIIGISAICIGLLILVFALFYMKIDSMQADYNTLAQNYNALSQHIADFNEAAPLSASEVETFQHNMDILTDFCGQYTERPEKIANACFLLKRNCQMNSARIVEVEERDIQTGSFYCIRAITEDGETYWFHFLYDSASIRAIFKGENQESLLFGVVE